jgi:hypothetical protein
MSPQLCGQVTIWKGFPNQGEIYLAALVASRNCKDKKKDWSGCTLGPIGPISGSQIPAPPFYTWKRSRPVTNLLLEPKLRLILGNLNWNQNPFTAHPTLKSFKLQIGTPQHLAHLTQEMVEIEVWTLDVFHVPGSQHGLYQWEDIDPLVQFIVPPLQILLVKGSHPLALWDW